jgi:hypothetical protein
MSSLSSSNPHRQKAPTKYAGHSDVLPLSHDEQENRKKNYKSRQQSGYTIQLRRMAQKTQKKRQKGKKKKKKKKEKRKETEEKKEKRRKFPPPVYVSAKTSAKMDST